MAHSSFWLDLERTFRDLQSKHDQNRADDGLYAWTPIKPGEKWHLAASQFPREITLFETYAERAAIKLGYKGDLQGALSFWLDLVRSDTPNFRSMQDEPNAGGIARIGEASADYCSRLHNEALKDEAALLQWTKEKIRITEQRLGDAKGKLERQRAEHHAASLMPGDRRYRECRRIETEIAKTEKHIDELNHDLQTSQQAIDVSADHGTSANDKRNFYPKNESYQTIVFLDHEFYLTPQAAAIVKVLHTAEGRLVTAARSQ